MAPRFRQFLPIYHTPDDLLTVEQLQWIAEALATDTPEVVLVSLKGVERPVDETWLDLKCQQTLNSLAAVYAGQCRAIKRIRNTFQ